MRLLPYRPVVEYRRGKDNPSDYMSRHPIESAKSSQEALVAEEYVDFIATESIPKAMTATEVIDATSIDPTLCCQGSVVDRQVVHDGNKVCTGSKR